MADHCTLATPFVEVHLAGRPIDRWNTQKYQLLFTAASKITIADTG